MELVLFWWSCEHLYVWAVSSGNKQITYSWRTWSSYSSIGVTPRDKQSRKDAVSPFGGKRSIISDEAVSNVWISASTRKVDLMFISSMSYKLACLRIPQLILLTFLRSPQGNQKDVRDMPTWHRHEQTPEHTQRNNQNLVAAVTFSSGRNYNHCRLSLFLSSVYIASSLFLMCLSSSAKRPSSTAAVCLYNYHVEITVGYLVSDVFWRFINFQFRTHFYQTAARHWAVCWDHWALLFFFWIAPALLVMLTSHTFNCGSLAGQETRQVLQDPNYTLLTFALFQ